jgi:hypothetical protein
MAIYVLVIIIWIFWPTLRQRFAKRCAEPS